MLETLRHCWALTPGRIRSRWWGLLVASLAMALVEAAAAMGLVLLLGLMTGNSLEGLPGGRRVAELLGAREAGQQIRWVCAMLLVLFVAKTAMTLLVNRLRTTQPLVAGNALANRLFTLYLRAPYVFHLRRNSAETIRNLDASVDAVYRVVVVGVLTIVTEVIVGAAILGLILLASPVEGLVVVGVALVLMVASYRSFQARVASWGSEMQELSTQGIIRARDALDGIKDVRLSGLEGYFAGRYAEIRSALTRVLVVQSDMLQTPRVLLEGAIVAVVVVLAAVLSMRTNRQELLPLIGLYAYAGLRLLPSVMRIWAALNSIRLASAATQNVFEDVAYLTAHSEAAQPTASPLPFEHVVELRAVQFRYDGGHDEALAGVDLRIAKGELVAVVGTSGSGKTTLVDVMLGLLTPQSGSILVDGQDIRHHIHRWQANFGYVPQSVFILDESLRRNVAFGVPDADIDDDRIIAALASAQLTEVLERLPEGLDTRLGERGGRLSGGQRQRVGIARALYAGRRVLVLDEAMSAVDSLTERELNDTIERLRHTHTIILITHRFSLLEACDQVVLMSGGKIVSSDRFKALYETQREFRALVDAGR